MKEIGLNQFDYRITPEEYLNELFAHTENGVLLLSQQEVEEDEIWYYRCDMCWCEDDLPALLEEYYRLLAVDPDQLPRDDLVKLRALRVRKLKELEAPEFIVQHECCCLMEALALREFGSAVKQLPEKGEMTDE